MKRYIISLAIITLMITTLIPLAPAAPIAQGQEQAVIQPIRISGTYSTTYYARFADWDIFPVLLPIINLDNRLHYTQRYDLRQEAQIFGDLQGSTEAGAYTIDLPTVPEAAAWLDTDGDPNTPSSVKVFIAGISNGMVAEDYVSRYDFMFTSSFRFDPNNRRWSGQLLVWSADDGAVLPVLNGDDNIYYTADDILVTVPAGWSVIEVDPNRDPSEAAQVIETDAPIFNLREPLLLQDVNLMTLTYEEAFFTLLDYLEATYIFTDYRRVDWDAIRTTYAPKAAKVSTDAEFQLLLESALFSFRDGHLMIIGPGIPNWYWGSSGAQLYPVGDDLMVVEVAPISPAADAGLLPGTVITQINGVDAMSYYRNLPRTIFSAGHESQMNWYRGSNIFRGEPGTTFEVDYRLPDGTDGHTSLVTAALADIGGEDAPRYPVSYRLLPNKMGYIAIYNFTSAQVDDLWDAALNTMLGSDVQTIIIDLRQNNGGFSVLANYMMGDFLDEDIYAGTEISSLDEDGDGSPDVQAEYYFGRQQRFDPDNLIVLVGPDCYSACEFAAQGFKDIGATVIGHLPTGGAGGGVGASYYLPGGTRVYGMAVTMSLDADDNVMIEGIGVELDMVVPFTAEGLASGDDLVLLAAQEFAISRSDE